MQSESWTTKYWSGRAPLWKSFWLVGVLGQLAILILTTVLGELVLRPVFGHLFAYSVSIVAVIATAVFASVSVWRSAGHARVQPLGGLARVLVVFYLGAWVLLIARING